MDHRTKGPGAPALSDTRHAISLRTAQLDHRRGIRRRRQRARVGDLDRLRTTLRIDAQHNGEDTNSLHVVLKPGMSETFQQALKSDGRLKLDALSERDYYAAQTKVVDQLRSLGLVVALALGVGATFGGMNTMYTAVARREREIGVLRVLGFSRGNILGSFVIESALLGLAGGIAGVALAFVVAWGTGLNSRLLSVGLTFFSYRATPAAIMAGLLAAGVIGVVGGLAPAWRAARIGVIDSLREA